MPTDDPLARDPKTAAAIAAEIRLDPELADLRRRQQQLQNRINRLTAIRSTRERKRRTRWLILLGTYVDEWHTSRPDEALTAYQLMERMDGWLTRPADRRVFGLEPIE